MVTEEQINAAAKALQCGELVAFPTETVYGLGANALDPIAVAKIFELKGRPRFDPLIVHVANPQDIEDFVEAIPELAKKLIEKFWPGPLSLVLQKKSVVPDIVTAGLPSVAVRCPNNDVARKLIDSAGVPVAAPSANRFGMVSPTTAQHVSEQFGEQLKHILDDGPSNVGVESTVIAFPSFSDGKPQLLRPGGVTIEQLEPVIGRIQVNMHEEVQPSSPGQLTQHYSPVTPLVLQEDGWKDALNEKVKIGLLAFQSPDRETDYSTVEILSENGCLRESATNLFAALRRLDDCRLDLIVCQSVPEVELGMAIMDRLRRAAAK
ncbi:MAG: L-threonylcarbamoyladenylate synthase [Mariniblastus sp.]